MAKYEIPEKVIYKDKLFTIKAKIEYKKVEPRIEYLIAPDESPTKAGEDWPWVNENEVTPVLFFRR